MSDWAKELLLFIALCIGWFAINILIFGHGKWPVGIGFAQAALSGAIAKSIMGKSKKKDAKS